MTDSHGVTHPSEPNYLAIFSGSTQGVTDDSCPQSFGAANLGSELIGAARQSAGVSFVVPNLCNATTARSRPATPG